MFMVCLVESEKGTLRITSPRRARLVFDDNVTKTIFYFSIKFKAAGRHQWHISTSIRENPYSMIPILQYRFGCLSIFYLLITIINTLQS